MNIEISEKEQGILKKVLNSYLSELRLEIAATKRGTTELHDEEKLVEGLIKKIS